MYSFRSYSQALGSVASSTEGGVFITVVSCPVKYRQGVTLLIILTCVSLWWVFTSDHSCFSLFQPMGEISANFLVVKSPLCRTSCVFVVSVLVLFKQNNFYFWLVVNLRKSLCFQVCSRKKKFLQLQKMLVTPNFLFYSNCPLQTINNDTKKPTIRIHKSQ